MSSFLHNLGHMRSSLSFCRGRSWFSVSLTLRVWDPDPAASWCWMASRHSHGALCNFWFYDAPKELTLLKELYRDLFQNGLGWKEKSAYERMKKVQWFQYLQTVVLDTWDLETLVYFISCVSSPSCQPTPLMRQPQWISFCSNSEAIFNPMFEFMAIHAGPWMLLYPRVHVLLPQCLDEKRPVG